MLLPGGKASRRLLLHTFKRSIATDSLHVLTNEQAMAHINTRKRFAVPPQLFPSVFLDWAKHACSEKAALPFENEFQLGVNVREIRRKHADKLQVCEGAYTAAKERMYSAGNVPGSKQSVGELIERLNTEILNLQYSVASYQTLNSINIHDVAADDNIRVPIQMVQSEASETLFGPSMGSRVYTSAALRQRQLYAIEMLPRKLQQLNEKLGLRRKLLASSTEYKAFIAAEKTLHDLQRSIGLVEAMDQMRRFKVRNGRGRGQRGSTFEDFSMAVVREHLLPQLALKHNVPLEDMFCLRNSKLALAQGTGGTGEFDCIVCIRAPKPARLESYKHKGVFCKVLAIVEFKRSLDDIGEAFLTYQSTLSWLVGLEDTYDAARWVAPNYPTGHFKDSPFIQYYDNIATGKRGNGRKSLGVNNNMQLLVMLTPESFADFVRTPIVPKTLSFEDRSSGKQGDIGAVDGNLSGKSASSGTVTVESNNASIDAVTANSLAGIDALFMKDIYFVSKDGYIEGVNSKQASWAQYKIASSIEYDTAFSNPAVVYELREKLQAKIPHRFSTLELLHLYEQYGCNEQMYLVGKFPSTAQ